MEWSLIENSLDSLQPVEGGFTNATRGIITTNDMKLFVKMGVDPTTKKWAQKEVDVYRTLDAYGYPYIPKLISVNRDSSGFALEYLSAGDGWEWETAWTTPRVVKTLDALDALAEIPTNIFSPQVLILDEEDLTDNPWLMPHLSDESKIRLKARLNEVGAQKLSEQLDYLQNDFSFAHSPASIVHYDVRRDNCAWNTEINTVLLVDWNWLHLGDRRIDLNALLVNIYKSGLAINEFSDRLDADALLWLAGYWLSSSVQPDEITISDALVLREYQFQSALKAYELATLLS